MLIVLETEMCLGMEKQSICSLVGGGGLIQQDAFLKIDSKSVSFLQCITTDKGHPINF